MDGGGRAGQGVVFVDVHPQGVLPDDGAGHGAGPGDDHPGVAPGRPAAARAGQLYQVSRVALTSREGALALHSDSQSVSREIPDQKILIEAFIQFTSEKVWAFYFFYIFF